MMAFLQPLSRYAAIDQHNLDFFSVLLLWKSSKTQEREEENTHYLDKAVIIIKRRGKVAGKKFIFT